MTLKEIYRRFRDWQREPFSYQMDDTVRHCSNCNTEFSGNFCPCCGQKADVNRVGWKTVRQGVMVIWGMDSASLSNTILQLVLRPGYLIGDYIGGKRQVAYPPVKMLFIVAAAVLIIFGFFYGIDTTTDMGDATGLQFVGPIVGWMEKRPGWGMLIMTALLILPTWLFFRYSPRHPRHTLPEGFFVQVFMATLLLIICVLAMLSDWFFLLIPIYYVVAYRQLFGYRLWGTIWRVLTSMAVMLLFLSALIILDAYISSGEIASKWERIATVLAFFVAIGAVLSVATVMVSRRTEKLRNNSKQSTE